MFRFLVDSHALVGISWIGVCETRGIDVSDLTRAVCSHAQAEMRNLSLFNRGEMTDSLPPCLFSSISLECLAKHVAPNFHSKRE